MGVTKQKVPPKDPFVRIEITSVGDLSDLTWIIEHQREASPFMCQNP